MTLVVPSAWPNATAELRLAPESFRVVELQVRRPGDPNRHAYVEPEAARRLLSEVRPHVLDVHEEPYSVAARQWLRVAPPELRVVLYTAQNVDKRLPAPFRGYERRAYERASALYPCSRQAASVVRSKGFAGRIEVIPLGYDEDLFRPGAQSLDGGELVLALVGRLVPEKGVIDAIHVLARVAATRPARLVLCGDGPVQKEAQALVASLGLAGRVELVGQRTDTELASVYRGAHVVLVPSRPTATWTEQFGRVIVEAQASGAVVAGYDSGSIPEVGREPAIVVRAGDVESLARRVLELAADPDEYARRRRDGIALAAERTRARVAERQLALYRAVASTERPPRATLPSSPARRRALARAEFGPTAATTAGMRPFALPLLRRGGLLPGLLAAVCDAVAEGGAWTRNQVRSRRTSA